MLRRLLIILLVLALLATSAVILWKSTPKLLETYPAPGADPVPARSSLRLTFTQPLRPDSAAEFVKIRPNQPGTFTWEGKTLVFTPDQPWPIDSRVQVIVNRGARSAYFPGLPVLETTSWTFQVGEMQLAYLWPSDGPADLYALDAQSGDIQRLTQDADILDFSLSPDRTSIFFSADDDQAGSRIFQLHLAGPKAIQEPQLLIECPQATCRLAQASPDGTWLAYEYVPLQQSGETVRSSIRLFHLSLREWRGTGEENHATSQPAWSTDGWLAFYDQEAQAYILLDLESQRQISLPNQTGAAGSWQPGGLGFAASEVFIETTGLLEPITSSQLIRFELSEGERSLIGQSDLSQVLDVEDSHPIFSPDGSQILYSRRFLDPVRWTPGRQLWIMAGDGRQARALTNEPAYNHYDFVWKPDSSQIAYVRSDPTQLLQPPELWLVNADGSEPIQLVIGGYSPAWIP